MPQTITLAVAQTHTLLTTAATLSRLEALTHSASLKGVDILLFPEAYLGGYPRSCTFGSSIGGRTTDGREQFLEYFKDAVDLGDAQAGAGEDWVERRLSVANGRERRGDGTREELERVAREMGVFLVVGVVERAGGSLYCGVVYVDPERGCIGKRRKVMPTGSERLVWAQGDTASLKAVTATIKGVDITLAAAICWENYMPLLRYSLYAQNVNLYLAPTADGRDTWVPLMRTIACEGRTVVMSANQCVRRRDLPGWIFGVEANANLGRAGGGLDGVKKDVVEEPQQNGHGRRKSVILKTEDDHEISWPVPGASSPDLEQPVQPGRSRLSSIPTTGGRWFSTTSTDASVSPNSPSKRRQSVITKLGDGHEICLPAPRSSSNEHNSTHGPGLPKHQRSSSSVIMDDEDYRPSTSSTTTTSPKPARRASVIMKTADNQEIAWPVPRFSSQGESSPASKPKSTKSSTVSDDDIGSPTPTITKPRRASVITKTPENHEICWPLASHHTRRESQSHQHRPSTTTTTSKADPNSQKDPDEFLSHGGSCIISPLGAVIAGPVWDKQDELLVAEVDFEDCVRGKLDFDVAGGYSRSDAFELRVVGLDLSPPG